MTEALERSSSSRQSAKAKTEGWASACTPTVSRDNWVWILMNCGRGCLRTRVNKIYLDGPAAPRRREEAHAV